MPYKTFSRNVWLLSVCHAFSFTGASVTFFLGGIICALLAPSYYYEHLTCSSFGYWHCNGHLACSYVDE